jgi:hypothetical protein
MYVTQVGVCHSSTGGPFFPAFKCKLVDMFAPVHQKITKKSPFIPTIDFLGFFGRLQRLKEVFVQVSIEQSLMFRRSALLVESADTLVALMLDDPQVIRAIVDDLQISPVGAAEAFHQIGDDPVADTLLELLVEVSIIPAEHLANEGLLQFLRVRDDVSVIVEIVPIATTQLVESLVLLIDQIVIDTHVIPPALNNPELIRPF